MREYGTIHQGESNMHQITLWPEGRNPRVGTPSGGIRENGASYRGQKNRTRKKTNSWERRFPGTFRTNVPLILPIFSVFSVGGGPKVPRNFVPGNFFFFLF